MHQHWQQDLGSGCVPPGVALVCAAGFERPLPPPPTRPCTLHAQAPCRPAVDCCQALCIAPAAGTPSCHLQLSGFDQQLDLLTGALDGEYLLSSCWGGKPLYRRAFHTPDGGGGWDADWPAERAGRSSNSLHLAASHALWCGCQQQASGQQAAWERHESLLTSSPTLLQSLRPVMCRAARALVRPAAWRVGPVTERGAIRGGLATCGRKACAQDPWAGTHMPGVNVGAAGSVAVWQLQGRCPVARHGLSCLIRWCVALCGPLCTAAPCSMRSWAGQKQARCLPCMPSGTWTWRTAARCWRGLPPRCVGAGVGPTSQLPLPTQWSTHKATPPPFAAHVLTPGSLPLCARRSRGSCCTLTVRAAGPSPACTTMVRCWAAGLWVPVGTAPVVVAAQQQGGLPSPASCTAGPDYEPDHPAGGQAELTRQEQGQHEGADGVGDVKGGENDKMATT